MRDDYTRFDFLYGLVQHQIDQRHQRHTADEHHSGEHQPDT
jgi:hypothetical protein